jgi:hypothetical protein
MIGSPPVKVKLSNDIPKGTYRTMAEKSIHFITLLDKLQFCENQLWCQVKYQGCDSLSLHPKYWYFCALNMPSGSGVTKKLAVATLSDKMALKNSSRTDFAIIFYGEEVIGMARGKWCGRSTARFQRVPVRRRTHKTISAPSRVPAHWTRVGRMETFLSRELTLRLGNGIIDKERFLVGVLM